MRVLAALPEVPRLRVRVPGEAVTLPVVVMPPALVTVRFDPVEAPRLVPALLVSFMKT